MQLGKICNHNNVIHNAFQNYNLLAKQYQIMQYTILFQLFWVDWRMFPKNSTPLYWSPGFISLFLWYWLSAFSIAFLRTPFLFWWFVFPQSFLWADGTQVETNHFVLLLSSKASSHLGFVLEELKRRPALFVGFLPWNICYRRNSS